MRMASGDTGIGACAGYSTPCSVACQDFGKAGFGKPMEDAMATVDGVRAATVVRAVLAEIGLGRHPKAPGAEAIGWSGNPAASGFTIRRNREPDLIDWTVVVSGKPHLGYRRWTEDMGGGRKVDLIEPVNPHLLHPRILDAFESLGLRVFRVHSDAGQIQWEGDDVRYTVTTDEPAWLLPRNGGRPQAAGGPALVTFAAGPKFADILGLEGSVSGLAGYDDAAAGALLTRESVGRLLEMRAAATDRAFHAIPRDCRIAMGLRDGVLSATRDGRSLFRAEQLEVGNHWGDRVAVWRMPAEVFLREPEFTPDVPFILDGELRDGVPPLAYDAQFGGDVPWQRVEEPTLEEAPAMAM